MAELAKANNIKVVLCSVVPAYDYWWRHGMEPAEKIVALNKMIKGYAEKNHFVYIDYHKPMKDEKTDSKSNTVKMACTPTRLVIKSWRQLLKKEFRTLCDSLTFLQNILTFF
ncbi:hypothetical protein [Flavobacterium sp. 3HN19-14]|uniref:hypothetical protein n=1 Tax=Flavobacterium sp. 3HN19-14 TaxID=3448133 RepID=UPI003EE29FD1